MTSGGEHEMDPARLRVLMEGAVSGRPPVPRLVPGALRQGLRIRRRRRVQAAAALAAALAVVIVAPLAAGALTGHHPPARPGGRPTAFAIVNGPRNAMVVPVMQRSDTAGRPIAIRGLVQDIGIGEVAALGPGGRTLYVLTTAGLTPVDVATSTAGRTIPVACGRGCYGIGMLLSPDGTTAWIEVGALPEQPGVLKGVVSVNLSTGRAGRRIPLASAAFMAITPDGRTVYLEEGGGGQASVLPINTATDTALPPVTRKAAAANSVYGIAMAPSGRAVYLCYTSQVGAAARQLSQVIVPVDTATRKAGAPILIRNFLGCAAAFSADGKTVYVGGSGGVARIDAATGTLLPKIAMPSFMTAFAIQVDGLTMSSDGKTLYASNAVTGIQPIDVASNALLRPIRLGPAPAGLQRNDLVAVGPYGTAYVSFLQSHRQGPSALSVAPVSLATGQTGQPVNVGSSTNTQVRVVIVFAP
jgi:hypothetical protein